MNDENAVYYKVIIKKIIETSSIFQPIYFVDIIYTCLQTTVYKCYPAMLLVVFLILSIFRINLIF